MNKIIYTLAFLLIVLLTGCEKETLMTYETENNIYFNYNTPVTGSQVLNYSDTAHVKFGTRPNTIGDNVVFSVNLLGHIAPTDRSFKWAVDTERSTAISGTHYELPLDSSLYIPANVHQKQLTIKVFKPESLRDHVVELYLELRPNDYFQTNLPLYNETLQAKTLRILIDDRLSEPTIWQPTFATLGTYSRKKLELMVELYVLNINKFYEGTLYTTTQLTSYARTMQAYLNSQKASGNTIYELDGSEMKMGTAVQ